MYEEFKEFTCMLVVQLMNSDTGDPLDYHMLDSILEPWMSYFTDRAHADTYIPVRWSSDKFLIMNAANDFSFGNNVSALMNTALLMEVRSCYARWDVLQQLVWFAGPCQVQEQCATFKIFQALWSKVRPAIAERGQLIARFRVYFATDMCECERIEEENASPPD